MKAICQREGFLAKFQLASSVVPGSGGNAEINPILKNLKAIADAEEGRCTLLGTDLEVGIRLDVLGLTVEEPGEAILPAQQMLRILREASNKELNLEADSNACVVHGKNLYFEMPSEDARNFPDFPTTFTGDDYFEISAGKLREMIRRTIFAVAEGTGGARPAMTGVLWEIRGEKLNLVATDSKRLALAQGEGAPHGDLNPDGVSAVISPKALGLLANNLQDDDEMVRIGLQANEALFRTELATIYSLLVEGRFPEYSGLFSTVKNAVVVPLEVGAFLSAIRQAAIMVDDESKRVDFRFENGTLTLKAKAARSGRSKVEMPVVFDAAPIEVGFNPQYLVDMLRILPPDAEVQLEIVDGSKPALFRSGASYSYLVMPFTS